MADEGGVALTLEDLCLDLSLTIACALSAGGLHCQPTSLISLVIFYDFHTSVCVCVFASTLLGLIKYKKVRGHFSHRQ